MPAINYLTHVKHRKALEEIGDIVTAALDGEPTTADEYNKESFGGDTGTDADYYDENNEEYVK